MLATRIIGCYEKELSDSQGKGPEGCLAEQNWRKECMLVMKQARLGLSSEIERPLWLGTGMGGKSGEG